MSFKLHPILKNSPSYQPASNKLKKVFRFNDTVIVKALANDRLKTFHLPLGQLVHTKGDETLFFQVKPSRKTKIPKPIFLQYPSDPPINIDSKVGKIHQVVDENGPFPPMKETIRHVSLEDEDPLDCEQIDDYKNLMTFVKTDYLPVKHKKIHWLEVVYTHYCSLKLKRDNYLDKDGEFLEKIDNCLALARGKLMTFGFQDPDSETAIYDTILYPSQHDAVRFIFYVPETYWTLPNIAEHREQCIILYHSRQWSVDDKEVIMKALERYRSAFIKRGIPKSEFHTKVPALIHLGQKNPDCSFLVNRNLKEIPPEDLIEMREHYRMTLTNPENQKLVCELINRLLQFHLPSEQALENVAPPLNE